MIKPQLNAALAAVMLCLCACHNNEKSAPAPDFLAANLDTTISPATDFFDYANGGWIKNNAIPPEESAWGIGQLVQEDIYKRLKIISQNAADSTASSTTNSIGRKIGDLWTSGMDSAAI